MINSSLLQQTVRIAGLACSVDPITLTGLALAGLAGGAATSAFTAPTAAASSATTPTQPPAPDAAAPPVRQPTGTQKSGAVGSPQSFIGSAAAPSQVGYGQKTLLGQ